MSSHIHGYTARPARGTVHSKKQRRGFRIRTRSSFGSGGKKPPGEDNAGLLIVPSMVRGTHGVVTSRLTRPEGALDGAEMQLLRYVMRLHRTRSQREGFKLMRSYIKRARAGYAHARSVVEMYLPHRL